MSELLTLPENWDVTTLENVGDWGSGGTPSRKDPNAYGGKIPWVKIGDLFDRRVESSEETLTEHGLHSSSAKLLDPETLLIAMYGASIGKLGITATQCTTNQAIASCRPFNGICLKYLFYFLMRERQSFIAKGQGGAQPNISQTILKEHPVPLGDHVKSGHT